MASTSAIRAEKRNRFTGQQCQRAGPRVNARLGKFLERIRDGGFNFAWAVAAELAVHVFKAADEIEDLFARIRAAGGFAEMCATAKRTIRVDHTFARVTFEQRTRAVGGEGKFLAPRGAKAFRSDQCFPFGEVRGLAGELEAATLGAGLAGAFEGTLGQLGIDRADFRQCWW